MTFFSHAKFLENVVVLVETENRVFGSFHSFLPKSLMQDMVKKDDEMFVFEEVEKGSVKIVKPKNAFETIPCFFGEKSNNVFGIFSGYWLKSSGSYVVDEGFHQAFANVSNIFSMKSGEMKRLSLWLCE